MKTRVFMTKAIVSMVNLGRYPYLPRDILDLLLDKTQLNDNNKINGLLMVLNKLAEKKTMFDFVPAHRFVELMDSFVNQDYNQ